VTAHRLERESDFASAAQPQSTAWLSDHAAERGSIGDRLICLVLVQERKCRGLRPIILRQLRPLLRVTLLSRARVSAPRLNHFDAGSQMSITAYLSCTACRTTFFCLMSAKASAPGSRRHRRWPHARRGCGLPAGPVINVGSGTR
jgi:hypothetical protein